MNYYDGNLVYIAGLYLDNKVICPSTKESFKLTEKVIAHGCLLEMNWIILLIFIPILKWK
jgi:hypothetical protein